MPIANCFVAAETRIADPDELVRAWSAASGIGSAEMTVNVIPVNQGGRSYCVMAWLYLPSLWSDDDVVSLSEGLAAALAAQADVDDSAVQVITTVLATGTVVESGRVIHW